MLIKANEITVIIGHPGYGKTFLAKTIFTNIDRHLIFDVNNEYARNNDPNVKKYCPFDLNRVIPRGREDVQKFFKLIWTNGNITAGIDEADKFFKKDKDLEGEAYDMIHLHYHRNIGVVAIARRTANLHNDVLAAADHLFIFRTFLASDLDWIRKSIGLDVSQARTLPKRHFLYYSGETGEIQRCSPVSPRGSGRSSRGTSESHRSTVEPSAESPEIPPTQETAS